MTVNITIVRHRNPLITDYQIHAVTLTHVLHAQRFYLNNSGDLKYAGISGLLNPKMDDVDQITKELVLAILTIPGVDCGELKRNHLGSVTIYTHKISVWRTKSSTDEKVEAAVLDIIAKVYGIDRKDFVATIDDHQRSEEFDRMVKDAQQRDEKFYFGEQYPPDDDDSFYPEADYNEYGPMHT